VTTSDQIGSTSRPKRRLPDPPVTVSLAMDPSGTPVSEPVVAEPGVEQATDRPRSRRFELGVALAYLIMALWVVRRLWTQPHQRILVSFPPDQFQFELWLTHATRIFTHGENPFFFHQVNYPDGVNMLANTGTFGMTIPLVPVTSLFGPSVSFAVMCTVAPFLTSLAWYFLYSGRLLRTRLAAAVAGAFCGFGPGVLAQDNVHPNIAMQAALPLIFWQVLRIRDRRTPVWKPGVLLGLLVIYQFFVNEEMLLQTALFCLLFVLLWAWFNRPEARNLARRLLVFGGIGGAIALVALVYPLWYQFRGPQHYPGLGSFTSLFGLDIASFTAYGTYTLGNGLISQKLTNGVVEEASFYGWPLVAMVPVWTAVLWRRTAVRAAAITAVLFLIGSLGEHPHVGGVLHAHWPAPWALVAHLPLLDSIIANRLAMMAIPVVAVVIGLTIDELPPRGTGTMWRTVTIIGLVAALVPAIPIPFTAQTRKPVPAFITDGTWRQYVPAGRSMAMVPIPVGIYGIEAEQWTTATSGDLPIVGGYFVLPNTFKLDNSSVVLRPTLTLFQKLRDTHKARPVTEADKRAALADFRYWRSSVVVLDPYDPDVRLVEKTMDALIGFAPTYVDGVWLWNLQPLIG
jgi:hypothetical protein